MKTIAAILFVALMCAGLGAAAQFAVPDGLPPLPPGGYTCNLGRTHCLVNYDDLTASAHDAKRARDIISGLNMAIIHKMAAQMKDLELARIGRCDAISQMRPLAGVAVLTVVEPSRFGRAT